MLNKWIGLGRICNDLEVKQTQSGKLVLPFSVAIDRDYSKTGKETDFINVIAFEKTASFIEKYFSKGKLIAIEGRLQVRNYTDKEGNKRYVTEIIANNVYFAGDKQQQKETESFYDFDDFTDDGSGLPF